MTDKAQALLDLAARVEAATGVDRELDAWIRANCAPSSGWSAVIPDHITWDSLVCRAAPFTGSLDAAMTLVPEGWFVSSITEFNQRTWAATLREGFPAQRHVGSQLTRPKHGSATPALALTAACLRALAAMESSHT